MKVREILANVASYIEDDDLSAVIKNGTENNNAYTKQRTEILFNCYKAVLNDVAVNYKGIENSVKISGKTFDLSALPNVIKRIVKVTDERGNSVRYEISGKILKTFTENASVYYEYIPTASGISDDFPYEKELIGERAFEYGICAEYCVITNRIEEALNWEGKYRQAVEIKTDYKKRRLKAGKRWGL